MNRSYYFDEGLVDNATPSLRLRYLTLMKLTTVAEMLIAEVLIADFNMSLSKVVMTYWQQ